MTISNSKEQTARRKIAKTRKKTKPVKSPRHRNRKGEPPKTQTSNETTFNALRGTLSNSRNRIAKGFYC